MSFKAFYEYTQPFRDFFKHEAISGIILLICASAAIFIANSPLHTTYDHIIHTYVTIGYGKLSLTMSVLHWINDGLMAIFFFVIGMEVKRELIIGELKDIKKTILPIGAALGGMIIPAGIYLMLNYNQPTAIGWGIPMATDIAFALGILSLVSSRKSPKGIAVFLATLAIVDDIGAIIVIAIFYTSQISWIGIAVGLIVLLILVLLNKLQVDSIPLFVLLGIILWICILKSGIHATIAGVLLGMTIPSKKVFKKSMLYRLEHSLTPWSTYLIMPIFALANSGVIIAFEDFGRQMLSPLNLGIFLGLFLGKQIGIFGSVYLLVKFNISKLPSKVTFRHIYGSSLLGGIGFTMSLFVASLSFPEGTLLSAAKVSIITASVLSAAAGYLILTLITPKGSNI